MIRFALILFLVFASVNAHAEDFKVCEDENQETICKPRIMNAIEQGDFLLVKEIVESGFDVNTHFPAYYGTTPLMHAVTHGERQIAFYLLEQGADPSDDLPIDPVKAAQNHIDDYERLIKVMQENMAQ